MSFTDDYLKELEKKRKKLGSLDKTTQYVVDTSVKPSGGYVSKNTAMTFNLPSTQKKKKDEEEDEDIAPVKDSGLDFFQKGSFADGFDWSDIPSAILGTAGDALLEAAKGVGSLGEGIGDAIIYGAAGIADLIGKDEWAEGARERAQKSVVDMLSKDADNYLEKYSVLGRTSDNILQGVGQVGGIIATGGAGAAAGLSSAGVTALTSATMGLSGVGSGMGEAYQGGATDWEALKHGLNTGAADAVTELIFGGLGKAINAVGFSKGLSSADDMLAKLVGSKFKKKVAKNIVEFGIKSGAEGLEEVFSGFAQAVSKHRTYMSEEDFGDILKDENLLEQFIVGAATSGMIQSGIVPGTYKGSLIDSIKEGRDFITGYNQNEQAVIKKEVENRIAEAEKDGKKLTAREKSEIEAKVEKDLEKGYISIDTIESALGNDPEYDSLLKESEEFNTLYETEGGKLTEKQKDRLAELKEKNKATPYESALKTAQQKRSSSVFDLVKDSRLAESYRERARINEDFKADFSKFKGAKHEDAAKKTLENIAKAGANNTNRVHDFADWLTKISGDTGLVFDLKSDEQTRADFIERQTQQIAKLEKLGELTAEQRQELAELKDTLEKVQSGKLRVNGDISGNGIVLNLGKGGKPLNRVTGHEVTHSLEQAKAYKDLRDAVVSYAKTKGVDVDSEIAARKAQYQGITNANPEAEFVADMVGDYLFNEPDFINNISVNHRNVFQKIYDEVKYLLKQATAGSKEARELERVKRAFEKAYTESNVSNSVADADQNVKYSIRTEAPPKNTKKAYKLMRLVDGKLYPLFIGNNEEVSVGTWYNADSPNLSQLKNLDAGTHLVDMETGEAMTWEEYAEKYVPQKNGKPARSKPNKDDIHWANDNGYRFMHIEDKAGGASEGRMLKQYGDTRAYYNWGVNGSSKTQSGEGSASLYAMRPGWHFGEVPSMHQIGYGGEAGDTVRLDNQVWVEVDMSADVDYNAEAEANWGGDIPTHIPTNGYYKFATNPTQKKTKGGDSANDATKADWYVAGAFKVNRILSDSEADAVVNQYNRDTGRNVPLDYRRNNGRVFNAETMSVEDAVKYSLSDTEGRQLSNEQQEYFKDSVVRDENGSLKVMYHGTSRGGHTVFDINNSKHGLFGMGFYFTDSKNVGESYTQKGKGKNPQVYESYLNIKNPMDMDAAANAAEWQKHFPDADFPESGTNEDFYRAVEEYYADQYMPRWEVAEEIQATLESGMGYDGITHIGGGRVNPDGERHRVYIAFQPEQIKNVDNSKPTDSPDIRYSLSDSDGKQLTKEQADYFKNSKMRDADGNLKVMYHGSQNGGFHVFDPAYSDDDTSLFFVDRNDVAMSYSGTSETYAARSFRTAEDFNRFFAEIGAEEYRVEEQDYNGYKWFVLYDEDTEVASSETANLLYEEFKDWSGLGYGDVNYKVYLNLTNPYVLDAKGKMWHDLTYHEVYNGKPFDLWRYGTTRDVAKYAKEQGFDGVIFNNIRDNGTYSNGSEGASTVAIAFDSNQIKSVANDKPTEDADIRYSLSDSQGRELSKEQQQYFKGSKVVDENGKLKAVYHGSPSEFNTFSLDYLGTNGTAEGYGFYFTDKKSIAENYTKGLEGQRQQEKTGKLFEVYLDIKKPLSDKKVTMSRAQFKKFLLELNKQVDADGEPLDILSNYGDVDWEGLNKVINYAMEIEYDGSDNDVNLVSSIINGSGNLKTVLDVLRKTTGYDGIIVNEASWGGDQTIYLAFHPEQIKNVDNINPTNDPDIRRSLSNNGEAPVNPTSFDIYGKDFSVQRKAQDVAPVTEEVAPVAENATTTEDLFPDNLTPVHEEMEYLQAELEDITGALDAMSAVGDFNAVDNLMHELGEVQNRITELQQTEDERVSTLDDADAPPEMDAPYAGESSEPADPFAERDMKAVGSQKVKAYQYENPEVKPYFLEAAYGLMGDLNESMPGERVYNDQLHYDTGGEAGWYGTKRQTTADIADLKDTYGYTWDELRAGVNAIIEDDGAENNAVSKRIEFLLHDRLANGYTTVWGESIPANQEYINFINEKQINEYSQEAFARFMETADQYAPLAQEEAIPDIAPVAQSAAPEVKTNQPGVVKGQQVIPEAYEAIRPQPKKQPKMVRADKPVDQKTANIMVEEPKVPKKKSQLWSLFKENVLDNGMVFEDLSLKTKNRELQAKWNYTRYAQANAQYLIGNGAEGVKSLDAIRQEVEKTGKVQEFYEYLHHWLNVDRMTLEERYDDTPNKAVFGDSVTASMSRAAAVELGKKNPEFRRLARDIYAYNNHLRKLLVDGGVISQETADLWAEMYPHYVPIRRVGHEGLDINVPLDTGRTGVNAPVKRATGGNQDILPLLDTMGQRTMQTFRAIARNRFGVELMNTLGTTVANEKASVDDVDSSIDNQEGLLQEGKNGNAPTFTVFVNGEKVTFEITEEMYNALKPAGDGLSSTSKILNTASNIHRGLLTEYNPVFLASNAIKDAQEIIINSQHAAKTYARLPQAYYELAKKGKWYQEYMQNGGEQNTYFDNESSTFDTEEKGLRKLAGIPPLSWISKANNFIERAPRLAEYIASRKSGQSIEVSMLDAARVTTNFAAGGRLTKFLNRNGATFLNASVQGAVQQVRNIREAKANGLKGVLGLVGRYAAAGLPALLLNKLMWEDDEEYEELSDYVKQNYYVVAKFGDGQFVRIPKGRTVAVIQNAMEQIDNVLSGEEADWGGLGELAISNLAPNNPIENNILAPIIQVANNKTWYGEDLVPTRLQDLPAAEQYDESTDAISRWLGEKLDYSPVKINYLLDQYSGGIGDTILPMLTPEAESGDNSLAGNILAPWKSKFTTDSVMNNQNVADFYDTKDELATNAKASTATDKDVLMSKYMNSVNAELSELYAQKREIQNSYLPDSRKYKKVREIQEQIVELTKEGLATYSDVKFTGDYAVIGDRYYQQNEDGEWQKLSDEQVTKYKVTSAAGDAAYASDGTNHYRWYEPGEDAGEDAEAGWRKITDKELERQNEVTEGLGITPEEYWSNQDEYAYAYDHPENYAVAKSVGGYEAYKTYSGELYDIKADKDENGKSISGSRKDKVLDYINNLDCDYGTKIILFKNEYNADDTYNQEIIEYLNSRNDISWEEMETILKKLGFTVDSKGNISW